VGAETAWQIPNSLRVEIRNSAIPSPITRGVDEDDARNLIELGEKVDTSGAAIEQTDARNLQLGLEAPDRVHSDAFIAHQDIADAEDEDVRTREQRVGNRVRFSDQGGIK